MVHQGRVIGLETLSWRGRSGKFVVRDVVRHPGGVVILPVLSDGRLLLIRNQRVAVGARLLEVPAGSLERGEDPAKAASREVEEETGYAAGRLEPLSTFYSAPGFCDEVLHLFVAHDLRRTAQRLEDYEEIEVVVMTCMEALAAIDSGDIRDAKTIAAILLWERRTGASDGRRA